MTEQCYSCWAIWLQFPNNVGYAEKQHMACTKSCYGNQATNKDFLAT